MRLRGTGMAALLAALAVGAASCSGGCGKKDEAKSLDCTQGTHQDDNKCVPNSQPKP